MNKRNRVEQYMRQIRRRAAMRSHISEEEVRQWIEHGGPAELRNIRVEMANLWRDGLIELTSIEGGDFRAGMTEFGKSVAAAQDQEDAPVCKGCGKSSGLIKRFLTFNTKTGSDLSEWMHEDCFVALPLVQ